MEVVISLNTRSSSALYLVLYCSNSTLPSEGQPSGGPLSGIMSSAYNGWMYNKIQFNCHQTKTNSILKTSESISEYSFVLSTATMSLSRALVSLTMQFRY